MRRIPLFAGLSLFAILLSTAAPAQNAALTGVVTSAEEGAMEGVLVSAKKAGSTITITVVSDREGRFSFPAGKLAPGEYTLTHPRGRLRSRHAASRRGCGAEDHHADLKLRKTEDLAAQMSNGEWINSIPGTDQQKGMLLGCVGCHTLERVDALEARRRRFHQRDAAAHAELTSIRASRSIRNCGAASG